MGKIKLILLFSFFILAFGLKAQNTRDVQTPAVPAPRYEKQEVKKNRSKSKRKVKKEDDAVLFRKRLKKIFREKAKIERKMEKPQYSDPSYFGHKRKPRKRANGKKKFCKECGLTH